MPEALRNLSGGLVVGGAVAVAGAAVAYHVVQRKSSTTAVGLLIPEFSTPFYSIILFPDNGVPTEGRLVKHSKQAPLAELTAAAERLLGLKGARLFAQSTKEELTSVADLAALSDAGEHVVVVLATPDGAALSSSAAQIPPLTPVPYGPKPLPIVGNTLCLLKGPYEPAAYNLWHNCFQPDHVAQWGDTILIDSGLMGPKRTPDLDTVMDDQGALRRTIFTSDPEVVAELVARQDDFPKLWNRPVQKKITEFAGTGLFTSSTTSETWQTAHGILPRGFNQIRIKNYYPTILEKTRSFMHVWAQQLPPAGASISHIGDWLTCMTADAVVKASMGMDMRNVERKGAGEELHPFISAFRFGLGYISGAINVKSEYGAAAAWCPWFNGPAKLRQRFLEAKQTCERLVADMVQQTRKGELGGPDSVLRAMLNDKSPANGELVRVEEIYAHVINLMIAGHETTAATLGFTLHYLTQDPDCMAKAVKEVEDVLGGREPVDSDIAKLVYLEACFREALRLHPAVIFLTRDAAIDTTLKGKWLVRRGQRIMVNNVALHRREDQWGGRFGDPNTFNPARWLDGAEKERHPQAFTPWGFGVRACIGSQFALWEAKTFLAMLLQRFQISGVPGFVAKPSFKEGGAAPTACDLVLHVKPIAGVSFTAPPPVASTAASAAAPAPAASAASAAAVSHGTPLLILFGSNTGTCEAFATQTADAARTAGFVVTLGSLDGHAGPLPAEGAVLVITSTYNGTPPDNARRFSKWLEVEAAGGAGGLRGVKFVVFGVGNSQWAATYQAFPQRVDRWLEQAGGARLVPLSTSDADSADFTDAFDAWLASVIPDLLVHFHVVAPQGGAAPAPAPASDRTALRVLPADSSEKAISAKEAVQVLSHVLKREARAWLDVLDNHELQGPGSDRSTRYVELALPEGMAYEAGDHLEVLPNNGAALVDLALSVLGLSGDEAVEWLAHKQAGAARGLGTSDEAPPTRLVVLARDVLTWLADLAAPPPKKLISQLAASCPCPPEAAKLAALADVAAYKEKVLGRKLTLPELLAEFRSVRMSLPELVNALPRNAPRYYSISSSPLATPGRCSITVGVVQYTTPTGRVHIGAASGAIAATPVGGGLLGSVRRLDSHFRLPPSPATPVIMVGPGTGVAPMMGFLAQRSALAAAGEKLGPAHLFFGCRSAATDYIYRDVLEGYLKSGVLTGLHVAFSRDGATKVYVQDLIAQHGSELWSLLQAGGHVYICGDAKRMAPDVKAAFKEVAKQHGGRSAASADSWMGALLEGRRYLEDVWAGN